MHMFTYTHIHVYVRMQPCIYTYIYIFTYVHIYIHTPLQILYTYMNTCAYTHIRMYVCKHILVCMFIPISMLHIHTYTYIRTQMYICGHGHIHIYIYLCTYMHVYMYSYVRIHAHTFLQVQIRIHIYTSTSFSNKYAHLEIQANKHAKQINRYTYMHMYMYLYIVYTHKAEFNLSFGAAVSKVIYLLADNKADACTSRGPLMHREKTQTSRRVITVLESEVLPTCRHLTCWCCFKCRLLVYIVLAQAMPANEDLYMQTSGLPCLGNANVRRGACSLLGPVVTSNRAFFTWQARAGMPRSALDARRRKTLQYLAPTCSRQNLHGGSQYTIENTLAELYSDLPKVHPDCFWT